MSGLDPVSCGRLSRAGVFQSELTEMRRGTFAAASEGRVQATNGKVATELRVRKSLRLMVAAHAR